MSEKLHPFQPPPLPPPDKKAFFPDITLENKSLREEVLRRIESNLVYAIQYGSYVTGDVSPTSMIDMIIIVEDTKVFHRRNMQIAGSDYGLPHSVKWHNWLNQFGFNFYHTEMNLDGQRKRVKYAVISRENFIRGCNGSLAEKEKAGKGAFGMYVAGRMQKAALKPFFTPEDKEKTAEIEEAMNSARIDGIWLSLGFLDSEFSIEDLLTTYVSLSYWADLRVEKPGKIAIIIERSRKDYETMLKPILAEFTQSGLITEVGDLKWEKIQFPSRQEVERRIRQLKIRTAATNYIKNVLTVGPCKGVVYAFEKIQRARAK